MYKHVVLPDLPYWGVMVEKKHFYYRPTQPKDIGPVKGKQSIFNLCLDASGLLILKDYPYNGAIPDGIVCTCRIWVLLK